jgi:hypothetical protein
LVDLRRTFEKLRAIDEDLASLASSALVDEVEDPFSSVVKAGKVSESLALWVGARLGIKRRSGDENLKSFIIRLQWDARLPSAIGSDFHKIREERNKAVHREALEKYPSSDLLERLARIVRWLVATFPDAFEKNSHAAETEGNTCEPKCENNINIPDDEPLSELKRPNEINVISASSERSETSESLESQRHSVKFSLSAYSYDHWRVRVLEDSDAFSSMEAVLDALLGRSDCQRVLVVVSDVGESRSLGLHLWKTNHKESYTSYTGGPVDRGRRILVSPIRSLLRVADYPDPPFRPTTGEMKAWGELFDKEQYEYRDFSAVIRVRPDTFRVNQGKWPVGLTKIDIGQQGTGFQDKKAVIITLEELISAISHTPKYGE